MILVSFFSEDNVLSDEIKICYIFQYQSNESRMFHFFRDTHYIPFRHRPERIWAQGCTHNFQLEWGGRDYAPEAQKEGKFKEVEASGFFMLFHAI